MANIGKKVSTNLDKPSRSTIVEELGV